MKKPILTSEKDFEYWRKAIETIYEAAAEKLKTAETQEEKMEYMDLMVSCVGMLSILDAEHKRYLLYNFRQQTKYLTKKMIKKTVGFLKGA